jgi:hypothetical protein
VELCASECPRMYVNVSRRFYRRFVYEMNKEAKN